MSVNINADTTNGLVLTSDTSGEIKLQSAGADIATVDSSGITMAAGKTLPASALTGSLPAGMGGKISQVVSTTKYDTWSGTTGSWQDITGLSVSITPSSTSNTVLVNVHINGSNADLAAFRLMRNATPIGIGDPGGGSRQQGTIGAMSYPRDGNRCFAASMIFLDSPSTTSATTYKLQTFCHSGAHYINRTNNDANDTYNSRPISTITVMEIQG